MENFPFAGMVPPQNFLDLLLPILRREAAQKSMKDQSRISPDKDQSRVLPEGGGLPTMPGSLDLLRPPAGPSMGLPPMPSLGASGAATAPMLGGPSALGALSTPGMGGTPGGPQLLPGPEGPGLPASPMGQPMQGGPESGYFKSALMMIQAAISPEKVAPIADAAGIPVPDLTQLGGQGAPPGLGGSAAALESPFLPLPPEGPSKDQTRIAAEAEPLDPAASAPLGAAYMGTSLGGPAQPGFLAAPLPFTKDPSRIAMEETPQLPMPLMPGAVPGQVPLPFRNGVGEEPLLPDAIIPSLLTGGPETPGAGPPIDLASPPASSTAVPTPAQSPIAALMQSLSGVRVDPNATRRISPPGSAGIVLPKDYTDYTQLLMALMQAQQGPQLGPLLGGGGY